MAVFESVREQVLNDLGHKHGRALRPRQLAHLDLGAVGVQIAQAASDDGSRVQRFPVEALFLKPRIGQHALDPGPKSCRRGMQMGLHRRQFVILDLGQTGQQQRNRAFDGNDGLQKVMYRDECEAFVDRAELAFGLGLRCT